jgi:hypothetical protein
MTRAIALAGVVVLLALGGCSPRNIAAGERYQIVADRNGFIVRLDTWTGEMRAYLIAPRDQEGPAQRRDLRVFEVASSSPAREH